VRDQLSGARRELPLGQGRKSPTSSTDLTARLALPIFSPAAAS